MARRARRNIQNEEQKKSSNGLLTAFGAVFVLASLLQLFGFGGDYSLAAPSAVLTDQLKKTETMTTTTSSAASTTTVANPPSSSSSSTSNTGSNNPYQVSETCLQLPKIRPAGSVLFQQSQYNKAASRDGIEPAFHVGSIFPPDKIPYHMGGLSSYRLIKEHVEKIQSAMGSNNNNNNNNKKTKLIALDVGANQGFFTWYLASLGVLDEVHSFEINKENFDALQHGTLFNPPDVANRVNLYPMGLSNEIGRFALNGGDYRGFLKAAKGGTGGSILSVTMDCFAHHTGILLDNQHNNGDNNEVAFVKIDVEGFEIRVLQGAKQSLLSSTNNKKKIGCLLVEVGPHRWLRSGARLAEGIETLQDLSTYFEDSYVIFREGDTCPGSKLKSALSSPSSTLSRELDDVQLYKVAPSDWEALLTLMKTTSSDCDFWYTNNPSKIL